MLQASKELHAQDIRNESSTQLERLGSRAVTQDGKIYRYAKAGEAHTVALVQCAATVVSNHNNRLVAAAQVVGDTVITAALGATAAAADAYAEGYVTAQDNAGEGVTYLIEGHAAVASSGTITARLAEPITVAVTTASEVSFSKNPYKDVVVAVTDQADMAVGVPNIAVTSAYYYWIQTGGPCAVVADSSIVAGAPLTQSPNTAGQVDLIDGHGEVQIGVSIEAGVSGEHTLAYLTIDS